MLGVEHGAWASGSKRAAQLIMIGYLLLQVLNQRGDIYLQNQVRRTEGIRDATYR